MKGLWGWVGVCWLVVSFATQARAEEWAPIPVCVRPRNVPRSVEVWSYWNEQTMLLHGRAAFAEKSYLKPTFVYDPEAPPENTRALPDPYKDRPCDPKPPKRPPVPGAEKAEANEAPAPQPPPSSKIAKKDEAAPPPKQPPPSPKAAPRDAHERLRSVLPMQSVLPMRQSVLPHYDPQNGCTSLPMRGRPQTPCALACTMVPGGGTKPGKKKTTADEAAEQLAFTAAIFTLQFNEDTKRPDGKPYGIVGGMNPNGPNNPCLQVVASAVMIATVVLSPAAEAFGKKLETALAKKTPLVMKEMEKMGLDVAEEVAKKLGPQLEKASAKIAAGQGEALVRAHLADALEKNGAIGPYEVMKQFTDGLGGRWQAHHILEKKWVTKLELGNADKVPSVILTEAEHKKITAVLAKHAKKIDNAKDLWAAYQEAYIDHPTWLAAIEKYFIKRK